MKERRQREQALKRKLHRLKLSHGRTRRPHRKLHRSKKLSHKLPHRKMKKRRHRKMMQHRRNNKRIDLKKMRNYQNRNSKKVESNLVKGVNKLMKQERKDRVQMFNDWKRYYDAKERQNIVI